MYCRRQREIHVAVRPLSARGDAEIELPVSSTLSSLAAAAAAAAASNAAVAHHSNASATAVWFTASEGANVTD